MPQHNMQHNEMHNSQQHSQQSSQQNLNRCAQDNTTAADETMFSRLELIMGTQRLHTLQQARVMVLGLGGVGSNAAIALARGGVGTLILVDRDYVSPSNINRQAVAFQSTIGKAKTDVMCALISDINPQCKVICLQAFLDKDTIAAQLEALPRPHYVIDAIDTIAQKLRIAQWCQDTNIPLIASMGGANKLNPERFHITTIEKTKSCPVCKVMRKECKKRNIRKLEVLYSTEVPIPQRCVGESANNDTRKESAPGVDTPIAAGTVGAGIHTQPQPRPQKAQTLGTMSYIPPIMGFMLAGHVICKLTQLENPYANYQH